MLSRSSSASMPALARAPSRATSLRISSNGFARTRCSVLFRQLLFDDPSAVERPPLQKERLDAEWPLELRVHVKEVCGSAEDRNRSESLAGSGGGSRHVDRYRAPAHRSQ